MSDIRKFVNNWHNVSLGLAAVAALLAVFSGDMTQKMILAATAVMFLHFFEEFGFPGGFPLMGMRVLMNSRERDSSKWNCNNLNSMFGNWEFCFLVYGLALIFPSVRFLTLSAMLFLFAEILMHLVLFNFKLKRIYNPGMLTGVLGFSPIAYYYFTNVFDKNFFAPYDYILAVAWFALVFWFSFRSPLYWNLGKLKGYALTRRSAYGLFD